MEKHGVVPDIIDVAPQKNLEVSYPSGVNVYLGNQLTPTQVKDEPTVKWEADGKALYTLCMIDPDVPSRQEPTMGAILHWLVGNIPGNEIEMGELIAKYIGSGPPLGSGFHRYIFLVYLQSGRLDFEEIKTQLVNREGRRKFSIRKFAEKFNLGNPVAGNFYNAQYDEYVDILHKQRAQ